MWNVCGMFVVCASAFRILKLLMIALKSKFLFFVCLVAASNCFSQKLVFNGSVVDSVTVASNYWYYHFDDKGTTTYTIDNIYFVYDEQQAEYRVNAYKRKNVHGTFKPNKVDVGEFSIATSKDVDKAKLNDLLTQLTTSDSVATLKNSGITEEEFLHCTKRNKMHAWIRRYRKFAEYFLYYDKQERKDILQDLRNVDTLNRYLSEEFRFSGYPIVTDVGDSFWITISTDSSDFEFQGKYPDTFRQPLHNMNDLVDEFSVLNLKINKSLVAILPKKFSRIRTIKTQALMDEYIIWLLKRRSVIY